MCGIAGFLAGYERVVAARMGQAIAHRGPDSDGIYFDSDAGIALVHRRLAIQDLSPAGAQPMDDASGRFCICYNGEIYNFPELRRALQQRGAVFKGGSDTEIIVELFARDGAACFTQLNGIFALAVWDRANRELFLARDGLGVKPLYIHQGSRGIAFASEIKALMPVPGLDRTLDPIAAISYLSYLYTPGARTMFRDVTKLAPGHVMRVRRGHPPRIESFYRIPAAAPDTALDDAALIAGTRTTLAEAVERQMIADVEVGAFLSGGLDSSALVALAKQQTGRALRCFTIDYDARSDEGGELETDLPYARRAASHLGVSLDVVHVDARMASEFEQLIYTLDEPEADPAAINSMKIAALARSNGLKVLLSGAGGDDIFTGYRRHKAAAIESVWRHVPKSGRRALAWGGTKLPAQGRSRRLRKLLEPLGRGEDQRLAAYFEWLPMERAESLLAHGGDALMVDAARAPMQAVLDAYPGPPVERLLKLDQHFFLTDHNLNYTDKTGMAHGVEIRVPFLDHAVIAWAARIPLHAKMRRGETKWVLRKVMEPLLPHDIIYRPKTGFGVPLRAWLKRDMRDMVEDLLSPHVITARGLFSPEHVARLRQDTDAGRIDGSYSLLGLMAIELWCRKFADAAPMEADEAMLSAPAA